MFKQLDFLYRVGRLREALKDLDARGWEREGTFDMAPAARSERREAPDQLRGVAGHGRLAIGGCVI